MACKNSPFMGSEGKFVPRQKSQCFEISLRELFSSDQVDVLQQNSKSKFKVPKNFDVEKTMLCDQKCMTG